MATAKVNRNLVAGGATISLGGGFLLQISGSGSARIININDGPDQIPLREMQKSLRQVSGSNVSDASITRAATTLFKAIAGSQAVRTRVAE